MIKTPLFLLFALSVFCSVPCAWAQAEGDTTATEALPPPEPQQETECPPEEEEPAAADSDNITAFHGYVSEGVSALSDKIDSFFGDPRSYEELSGTYMLVRGLTVYEKGGKLGFDGKIQLRLDLPNLKEKAHLVIASDDEETIDETSIPVSNTPTGALGQKDVTTSVQYVVQSTKRWDVRLQPGIKLSLDPEPFVRMRFRYLNPITPKWLSRTTLTPGWYDNRGWETRLLFDFERGTGDNSLFRTSTEGIWLRDDPREVLTTQAFLFTHPLGDRVQMAYQTGVTFEFDPKAQPTQYFTNIRYRRDIHKGWVFLELKPQLVFPRDDDFEANPSFTFTLDFFFGDRYCTTNCY